MTARSTTSSTKSTIKAYQCMEQILKDFHAYVVEVKETYGQEEVGVCPDDPIDLVNGAPPDKTDANRLSFTPQEGEDHKEMLRFYGRAMGKQMHRMPKEHKQVRRILETMKYAIREGIDKDGQNRRQHVDILIEYIPKLLMFLQPLDLEKLIDLLKKNRQAGDKMEAKEVVLLLGSVGSGKTTTLHLLAGTSFTEVEVDGFQHLQPNGWIDPSVASYKTSYGREAITKALQTAQIKVDGKTLVICDTPGFGDIEDFEQEIANGLGIVRALHRAKSVRPVLILSREGMGDRFSAFSETLASVTRLIGQPSVVHLKPMNYVFTKYEKRHRNCLCRQFVLMKKRPRGGEEEAAIFSLFVEDIIQKTTPEAQVALPMEDGPQKLLHSILAEKFYVMQPQEYFVPSVSDAALRKLKLQLQITLRDIVTSLADEDYALSEYRMEQLTSLALVLPEAEECAQLGLEACLRQISTARERVANIVKNIQKAKVHKQFTQNLAPLKADINKVVATERLRQICERFERKSTGADGFLVRKTPVTSGIFCEGHLRTLINFVSQGIPEFDPAFLNTEALMKTRGSFLTGVIRLKEMSEVLIGMPGEDMMTLTYHKAFDRFYTFVASVLSEAESHFPTTPLELQRFERQAWFLAVLIQGFLNKPNSGTGEHTKMEELENRRVKLMLRLEVKISDTLDMVANTRFPDGKEEDSISLPIVKVSGLRAPREFLLTVSEMSRLCKFLPSQIDCAEIETAVAVLDRKIVNFLKCTVAKAESLFNRLEAMKAQKQPLSMIIDAAISVRHDLKLAVSEFSEAHKWAEEMSDRMVDDWERLLIVQEAIEASIASMELDIADYRNADMGILGCGMLSPRYLCTPRAPRK